MKKSLILALMALLLSACGTRVSFEKSGGEESCHIIGEKSNAMTILCDESTISINSSYTRVKRVESFVPFMAPKRETWVISLIISVRSTDSAPLFMNSQTMTIDQPSRLQTPIFLVSESYTKTTKSKIVVEQEVQKVFEIEIDKVAPFVLSGLEIRVGDQKFNFNGIPILPD